MKNLSQGLELYLHIPFCKKKCSYCDFVSFAGMDEKTEDYTEAICEEIRICGRQYGQKKISSIYIGGGTPSVLKEHQTEKIVKTLEGSFDLKGIYSKRKGLYLQKKMRPLIEFSIEINPGTASPDKLRLYKKLGINRLSFGLQSADDDDLKMLGRIHSFDDMLSSMELSRSLGFDNINIDLMQAIPGQSIGSWKRVLALTTAMGPEHISAYSLMIEEGTELKELYDAGKLDIPDEDEEREIYRYTRDFLQRSGYRRYEISNYAKDGYECRHNIGYWTRAEYLGIGLNASSMIDNTRWKNTDVLDDYINYMKHGSNGSAASETGSEKEGCSKAEGSGRLLVIREEPEKIKHKEQMSEFVFLGLRMTEGISRQKFLEIFGQDLDFTWHEQIQRLTALKLIESDGDRLKLTERGIDVSNIVLSEFA